MEITFAAFYVEVDDAVVEAVKALAGGGSQDWQLFKEGQLPLMRLLFASARAHHPGCRLVILTDKKTPWELSTFPEGVELFRAAIAPEQFMMARLAAQRDFLEKEQGEGCCLFLDSDMLIQRELTSFFKRDFALALTVRDHYFPANGGFLALSGKHKKELVPFLDDMLRFLGTLPAPLQPFRTVQHAFKTIVDPLVKEKGFPTTPEGISCTFQKMDLLLLPAALYNHAYPRDAALKGELLFQEEAAIVHFHGVRKAAMAPYYEKFFLHSRGLRPYNTY